LSSTDSLIRLKNHLVQGWNKVSIRIAESSSFNKPKSHVQITEGTATMPITNIVCLQNLLLGVVSHPYNLTMKYNVTVKKKFTLQYGSPYSKVSTKGVYDLRIRTWPMYGGMYPAWTSSCVALSSLLITLSGQCPELGIGGNRLFGVGQGSARQGCEECLWNAVNFRSETAGHFFWPNPSADECSNPRAMHRLPIVLDSNSCS